jgi:hypothetical protein
LVTHLSILIDQPVFNTPLAINLFNLYAITGFWNAFVAAFGSF